LLVSAKNTSGVAILQGQVVYKTGYATPEQVPTIALASASSAATATVLGLANENILNNTIGDIAITGNFSPIDTSAFLVDDIVYLSNTPGDISTTPGTIESIIGRVITAVASGCIFIRCRPPTCSTTSSGTQGATGIQGATGLGSGGAGGTGASNTLNMNL